MKFTATPTPAQARLIHLHLAMLPVYGWLLLVWTAYAFDISPPGRLDRSGHIKGHDFAHFYVLGQIAREHASEDLYSFDAQARRMDRLVPNYENRFAPIHGPQISLLFAPLARLPYEAALTTWLVVTMAGYGLCCLALWRAAPALHGYGWLAVLLAAGYPPFFLLVAFGQDSVLAIVCVTCGYLALRARRPWLAGLALGSLCYKPALGVALPIVLLYGREWRVVLGAAAAAALQLAAGAAYFGTRALAQYVDAATHVGRIAGLLEPIPYQMQSLRSFFTVLLPWPDVAFAAYLAAAAVVVAIAAVCWRTRAALELRYSVLLLAIVLADPHVNAYDLVVIAPVFVLVPAWATSRGAAGRTLVILLCLSYYLSALEFVPRVTHVQVSVLALVALLVLLAQLARRAEPAPAGVRP